MEYSVQKSVELLRDKKKKVQGCYTENRIVIAVCNKLVYNIYLYLTSFFNRFWSVMDKAFVYHADHKGFESLKNLITIF